MLNLPARSAWRCWTWCLWKRIVSLKVKFQIEKLNVVWMVKKILKVQNKINCVHALGLKPMCLIKAKLTDFWSILLSSLQEERSSCGNSVTTKYTARDRFEFRIRGTHQNRNSAINTLKRLMSRQRFNKTLLSRGKSTPLWRYSATKRSATLLKVEFLRVN